MRSDVHVYIINSTLFMNYVCLSFVLVFVASFCLCVIVISALHNPHLVSYFAPGSEVPIIFDIAH